MRLIFIRLAAVHSSLASCCDVSKYTNALSARFINCFSVVQHTQNICNICGRNPAQTYTKPTDKRMHILLCVWMCERVPGNYNENNEPFLAAFHNSSEGFVRPDFRLIVTDDARTYRTRTFERIYQPTPRAYVVLCAASVRE